MEAPRPHRVTIRDVADHVGVSRSTISYALTQPDRLSTDMLRRVNEAFELLGYRPNAAARQLRVGRSRAIAMVVSDASNPVFSAVATGATGAAEDANNFVVLADSADDVERETRSLKFFEEEQVRGIVISPVDELPAEAITIMERGTPVVHLGTAIEPYSLPFVTGDDEAGGHLAVSHLVEIGRSMPLFLSGPARQFQFRRAGALRAARDYGVKLQELEVATATIRDSYAASLALIRSGRLAFDSVFAGNDLIGIGFLHAAHDAGVHVPRDVALVAYDDIDFAETSIVPLTTIRHDMHAIGRDIVSLLEWVPGQPITPIRHAPTLVRRQSTGFVT